MRNRIIIPGMTSQEQPKLPSYNRVSKWTKNHVIKWLIREGLEDCISSFENRNIDGPALLNITEEKLVTWFSDLRIKRRRQLAKCVNECKNQASNAKRFVGSLKIQENRCRPSLYNTHVVPSDDGESDGWDTDFDDDEDMADQAVYNPTVSTLNLAETEPQIQNLTASEDLQINGDQAVCNIAITNTVEFHGENSLESDNDASGYSEASSQVSEQTVESIPSTTANVIDDKLDCASSSFSEDNSPTLSSISLRRLPRPPEKSSIPKPPSLKPSFTNTTLRSALNRGPPPYRRPPSEPPPPPLPLSKPPLLPSTCTSSPPDNADDDAQEDYEIPICGNVPPTFFQKPPTLPDQIKTTVANYVPQPTVVHLSPNTGALQDTYEAIERVEEENYEVVAAENRWSGSSSSLTSSSSDRPVLPPRSQASSYGPPPPLPEKPRKYQDILVPHVNSNSDPLADVERPKLPRSKESFSSKTSEDQSQASSSQSVTGAITGLLSSVLSSRSIREGKKPVRDQCNSSGGDTASTTGSHSSRASTPEKSDSMSSLPGPTNNAPQLPDKKITPPINFPKYSSQVSFEDIGTNVANRPLPPVPAASKLYQDPKKEKDLIHQYSWFHDVERETAEQLLQQQDGDGVYLVRQSRRAGQANPYTLTILFSNRIFHLNLRQRPDGLFALGREKPREKTFSTVAELISYHQKEPILLTTRGEPAGKTCLSVTLEKS
ncbi:uncharacterized protein LOC143253166 isoform X3 [Tachypleus tridentatus]|uniref:uncharacterized protein LOC143253166 isoform X3 n=1 Tax=Tachypleus tridentatus TaxID=6853 RepID=UPI003FCF84BF